ncbi:MAG: DMT family transporter [Gammaproteobacteria bacterium]|nr:DMT family transporter [Gammaproteobacteria bacterium]MDE2252247.1 DMT family transporter [Gammaproteobacteria bacterium]
MVMAAALFTLMDAGMKLLAQHYSPLQVTALRSLASFPLVFVYVAWRSSFAAMLRVRWPLHMARGALAVVMLASFVYGLRQLPMTETYSIFYVAPLLITALSVPLLGERVGTARWLAIGIGLGGVLVVLRPTGTHVLTLGGLAVIASAVCYTISAIAVRILGRTDSMESLMFWLISMLAVGSTALAWPHWQAVRAADAWIIVGVGITGFCGQWGVTYAFRHGEVSAVAPFEYTSLVWTLGLDRAIWRTVPDGYTLLGAAIIIAAGLFLVRRERVHVEAEHP